MASIAFQRLSILSTFPRIGCPSCMPEYYTVNSNTLFAVVFLAICQQLNLILFTDVIEFIYFCGKRLVTHLETAHINIICGKVDTVFVCFLLIFRQVGIKNGMFFGQAKKLCPNLQAVSYDFDAYKEVAQTVYEILAR